MLPKNLQTVITKNQNFIIPKAVFELILAKKPNIFGYAVQDGEGLSIGREEGTPDIGDLETMNTETQGFRSILTFGWLEKGFNPDDILPLVLNDVDDNPFIALALEGDFPKHDINNGRTQEFNLANELIIPSLLDICELTDGDITKLLAAIGKPSFNNNFLAQVGHRGVLSILPHQGDFLNLSKNELGEVYDWGTMSQRHGFGDAVQEINTENANDVVKKPRFSFGKKTATPPAVPQDVATKGEGPKTSVPEVTAKEEPKATGPLPIRPPEWLHNNDDKRAWYQMVCGQLPSGWKKKIPVIPAEGVKVPATITDLKTWIADRKKSAIAASTTTPAPAKTETSAGAPKTGADIKAIREDENAPIIPAKDMEKVLDFVAKHLDGQSVQMQDPATIQAMEKKHGDFSTAVGCKPTESVNWPISGLFALGKSDYRAIVLHAIEMGKYARKYMEEHKMFDAPTVTTTETKIGDTGKKVESVVNEPAPTSKPKFTFGKKKAA